MTYCTIVEFEWTDVAQRHALEALTTSDERPVAGRIGRILSVDDQGARVIELWSESADARRHAEASAPDVGGAALPNPIRVGGFVVTSMEFAGPA